MRKSKIKSLSTLFGFFLVLFSVYCIFEVNVPQWKYYFVIKNEGNDLLLMKYKGIGFFNSLIFPSIQTLLLFLTGMVTSIKSFPCFSSYLINVSCQIKSNIKVIKRKINDKRLVKLKTKIEKIESDE